MVDQIRGRVLSSLNGTALNVTVVVQSLGLRASA